MAKNELKNFDFPEGKVLAGKYVVENKLGRGWEGEVYKIREIKTGIPRAAKFYYPIRNPGGRTVVRYSQKLNRLADCRIIMQYAHQDWITFRRQRVEFLVSEYIEGEVLKDYLARQPGKRLHPFEALHILEALCRGMQTVHKMREYHGDIHTGNIMIQRKGLDFLVKLIDFYHWNGSIRENILTDVVDLIHILYDLIGGQKHYAKAPEQIKSLCRGLKTSLIRKKFRTAGQLLQAIHQLEW
jgi:tRNA A-37 threonylcarbamoyl transferase component Bud32